ncbi:TIGR03560 family F420-dependent LLM class oxidoreductase [Sanguibacter sp. A247]|uniref:TIGR03560 family F420-dependent LLM class oxidoreductase n=1 Tax=unclassified Sanguibacter TaxID=2645534 RepID=UPI003FD7FE46
MDVRIFTEPQQGASYDDLLRLALASETLGFDAFFRSDHYLPMGTDGLPGTSDAWTTLAGLARDTATIRLGTLVTPVTFRHAGALAVQVAQVDQMSGGRVELGLGAGWYAREHEAYGLPFPDKRFDLLAEHLEVVTGLWATPPTETFTFRGTHVQVVDAPGLSQPVQRAGRDGAPGVPIIIGGSGPRRTPALAARFASEYNAAFPEISTIADRFATIRAAASAAGRAADDLICSAALVCAVGRDEAEFRRRAEAIGREPAELREHGVCGTVDEAARRVSELRDLGVERLYLQILDLHDPDHLELIAREVLPLADVHLTARA